MGSRGTILFSECPFPDKPEHTYVPNLAPIGPAILFSECPFPDKPEHTYVPNLAPIGPAVRYFFQICEFVTL